MRTTASLKQAPRRVLPRHASNIASNGVALNITPPKMVSSRNIASNIAGQRHASRPVRARRGPPAAGFASLEGNGAGLDEGAALPFRTVICCHQ